MAKQSRRAAHRLPAPRAFIELRRMGLSHSVECAAHSTEYLSRIPWNAHLAFLECHDAELPNVAFHTRSSSSCCWSTLGRVEFTALTKSCTVIARTLAADTCEEKKEKKEGRKKRQKRREKKTTASVLGQNDLEVPSHLPLCVSVLYEWVRTPSVSCYEKCAYEPRGSGCTLPVSCYEKYAHKPMVHTACRKCAYESRGSGCTPSVSCYRGPV